MKAIDEEYTFADSKYVEAFQRYEQALQDKNNVDRELNELKNKELDLTVGLERQSGEGRLILERMKNLKEQNERLTTELQAAKEEIDSIVRELDRLEGEKQEKQQVCQHHHKKTIIIAWWHEIVDVLSQYNWYYK